jgi:hypothetical protein
MGGKRHAPEQTNFGQDQPTERPKFHNQPS